MKLHSGISPHVTRLVKLHHQLYTHVGRSVGIIAWAVLHSLSSWGLLLSFAASMSFIILDGACMEGVPFDRSKRKKPLTDTDLLFFPTLPRPPVDYRLLTE